MKGNNPKSKKTNTESFPAEFLSRLEKPTYAICGEHDSDGFQIFTPEFIVNGMIDAIGKKEVLDFRKTILEPASGDGAFTGRILSMRLKTIKKDFARESLRALSTIYSIEMDPSLVTKQRNNIYSIMMLFADENKIVNEKYFFCLTDIIFTNISWGMTNLDSDEVFFSLEGTRVAFVMESNGPNINNLVQFYSWDIKENFEYVKIMEVLE